MAVLDFLGSIESFFNSLDYLLMNIPLLPTATATLFTAIVLKCTLFRGS